MNRDNLEKLIDMAAGRLEADLLITNCRLADVFNQRLIDGPLALGLGKIVGWGPGYQARATVDAGGGVVLPGLIDGHVHIESSSLTPAQFARLILPFGTTTIIADPHEIANVLGLDGIRYMLEAARKLPLDVRIMLPSCVPATPLERAGAVLTAEDLESLIGEKGVWGLGEVMDYPGVINHAEGVLKKILMARKHGRVIDGHSPGVSGRDLMAYAAAGIHTDHECVNVEEMLERLSLGQYVLMRLGSSANDLKTLAAGVTAANARRCVMCTDDREAADIMASGHINKLLRQAVAVGLDPLLAVSLATINAAECFGLKGKGGLAPGWEADLTIVSDLKDFQVSRVFVAGREVADSGRLTVEIEDHVPASVLGTVHLPPLSEKSFRLPLRTAKVRAMEIVPNSVLTKARVLEVTRDAEGCFDPRLNPRLNKLAVIERHQASGLIGLGVLAGYGLQNAALAVSVSHDSHNLVVAGDNDQDMLTAACGVERLGGGYSLVAGGRVLAELALPVAGLMSDRPAAEVAEGLEKIIAAAHRYLGPKVVGDNPDDNFRPDRSSAELITKDFAIDRDCPTGPRGPIRAPETFHPLINLIFLALPVIPELKLTATGLFDVASFSPVDLCVD